MIYISLFFCHLSHHSSEMKLILSALLVLGFSQFCAAAAANQDEMRVEVFIPERLGDPYLACFDISDCGYPCVPLSFAGESVNPSIPTKSLCMGDSNVRAPTLTAYATLDDGNTLDHLRVSVYPLDIKCRRGEDFQSGSRRQCPYVERLQGVLRVLLPRSGTES